MCGEGTKAVRIAADGAPVRGGPGASAAAEAWLPEIDLVVPLSPWPAAFVEP